MSGDDKVILRETMSEPYFENADKLAAELKVHNLGANHYSRVCFGSPVAPFRVLPGDPRAQAAQ